MENADSIKIEKFKSIKDFQLSSEQQSTIQKQAWVISLTIRKGIK